MRLSTERDRDDLRAMQVLHAAFDAGITFLDTADVYCLDEHDVGHNERLIARALATWTGDRTPIIVATKGGLTRPQGRWVPDGRARHLIARCEASRRALGVDRLPLYQLHAPDPRTPFATTVRTLASLERDGLVERIGLCNVTVRQIEEARGIADVVSVQVEINPWNDDAFLSGVAEYCIANRIMLIAHRPLGGAPRARKLSRDPMLVELAARHGATPHEIALAWLADLSPEIVPVPGATHTETARSVGHALHVQLTDADRAQLDERFTSAAVVRPGRMPRPAVAPREGEVVLVMGLPAAGKTTYARRFVAEGYARLNRDEQGGSLRGLVKVFDSLVQSGTSRVVLDNTYVSRTSRARVVQAAAKAGLGVRCVWLTTAIEDAQVNASWRMWSTYGRLLGPDEMRHAVKRDINAFGPGVQYRYQRALEPPDPAEGFTRIERVAFEREHDAAFTNRALIVSCDDVLARSRSGHRAPVSPDDVEIVEEVANLLRRYANEGWPVLGISWRPEIAEATVRAEEVDATLARIRERLGIAIDIQYCPHAGGPAVCWCRKPLPGLGVAFIRRHHLDAASCIYIGAGPHDAAFARRLGFQFLMPNS